MNQKLLLEDYTKDWLSFDEFRSKYERVEVAEHSNSCLVSIPKPLVSVVLITYQHRPYIENAIESVLKQRTDFDYEIILGDDESTDGTREICEQYANENPAKIRLMLHRRENNIKVLGQPCGIFQVVYNLLKCRGQFIALLSGDDEWLSELKLKRQVDFLEKNPDVSMTYLSHILRYVESGQTVASDGSPQYPKPSSALYRNLFQRLPEEMLHSISEDEILKGICMQHGTLKMTPGAGEILVNITGSNLYEGNSHLDQIQHAMNTTRLLYQLFGKKDGRFRRSYAYTMSRRDKSMLNDFYLNDLKSDFVLRLYFHLYRIRKLTGL
jgi:glycosyltransferase involved in cell wall biosynthesis